MKRLLSSTFVTLACLLLTLLLAACGDTPTPTTAPTPTAVPTPTAAPIVPIYPRAIAIPQLDELKDFYDFTRESENWKNAKIDTYKSPDSANQVKIGLTDAFKQNGWLDDAAILAEYDQIMRNDGGFYIGFHSGSHHVTVMGRPPASIAVPIPQIKDSTTVFFVIAFEKP